AVDEIAWEQVGVAGFVNFDATEHLSDDNFDVLIVDVDTGVTVDTLYFFDEIQLDCFAAKDAQDVLRVHLTRGDGHTGLDLLTVGHVEIASSWHWVATLFTLF